MIRVRQDGEERALSYEQFIREVQEGKIVANDLVQSDVLTSGTWKPAIELQFFRSWAPRGSLPPRPEPVRRPEGVVAPREGGDAAAESAGKAEQGEGEQEREREAAGEREHEGEQEPGEPPQATRPWIPYGQEGRPSPGHRGGGSEEGEGPYGEPAEPRQGAQGGEPLGAPRGASPHGPPAWIAPGPAWEAGEGPKLPWEEMDRVGFLRGLAGTVSLSLRNPEEFFRAIARGNAMLPALVFGILMAVFTGIIDSFYDFVALRLFGPAMQSVQSDLPEIFRGDLATSFRENLYIRGVFILLYPALTFVASGVVHMFLRVFSGPAGVRRDFASTFRVTNYVSAVGALVLLPFCGRLIAGIWEIVLAVRGYARVQGTSHFASIGAIVLTGLLFACLWALAASISGGLGVLRSMGSGGA